MTSVADHGNSITNSDPGAFKWLAVQYKSFYEIIGEAFSRARDENKAYQWVQEETDAVNNEVKIRSWKKIEVKFNANATEYCRNFANFKTKYENIKRWAKDTTAVMNKNKKDTGSGVIRIRKETLCTIDSELIAMLGCKATDLSARFDDDDYDFSSLMKNSHALLKNISNESCEEIWVIFDSENEGLVAQFMREYRIFLRP